MFCIDCGRVTENGEIWFEKGKIVLRCLKCSKAQDDKGARVRIVDKKEIEEIKKLIRESNVPEWAKKKGAVELLKEEEK